MANTLNVFRNGAACRVSSFTLVGFIDWLDHAVALPTITLVTERLKVG